MSNPSTAIGEHGQLSGRFPDACQLQVGIAIAKAALIRGERLGITGLTTSAIARRRAGSSTITNRQGWLRPTEGDKQAMQMRRSSVCSGSGSGRKRRTSRRQVNNSRRRVRKPSSKIIIKVSLCAGRVHAGFANSGAIGSMLTGPEGRRCAIVRAASASVGNGSASFFSPQATVGNLRVSQTECPPG